MNEIQNHYKPDSRTVKPRLQQKYRDDIERVVCYKNTVHKLIAEDWCNWYNKRESSTYKKSYNKTRIQTWPKELHQRGWLFNHMGKLVLIRKPKKKPYEDSKYILNCLLNRTAKLLKDVLLARLNSEVLELGNSALYKRNYLHRIIEALITLHIKKRV